MKLGYGRNRMFTGRQELLVQLHSFVLEAKTRKHSSNVIVIHGIGGVGKTQLALEYAYSHGKEFASIIWVDAETIASAQRSFLDFASRLIICYAKEMTVSLPFTRIAHQLGMASLINEEGQIDLVNCNTTSIVDAVKIWLNRNDNDNWIIIFDRFDDLESMDISQFFINTSNGSHIITSRRPESARLGRQIFLDGMSETECIALLSRSSQRTIDTADSQGVNTNLPTTILEVVRYFS
jgi:hypothetical protein